jgi:soluble P-type ATPase
MILLNIPGYKSIEVKNVVFDFNGTIAEDGILIEGIKERIKELSNRNVNIVILTADPFGTEREQCMGLPVKIETFYKENVSEEKKKIVEKLGYGATVSIGNGRNDLEMFKSSIISIAAIGKEGCFAKALFGADIVVSNIMDAIELLLNNNRIRATMRT